MKVIRLGGVANSQSTLAYVRQGIHNYGPVKLELPFIFYSQHLPERQLLQLLTNFLIKIGDKKTAESYLTEFKEKFSDSPNISDLEQKLAKAEQKRNTKVEIRGFETDNAFFLYTDDLNVKFEAKKYQSIFSKPIRKSDILKYKFDISKNFEMPTHWQELLEKQKNIHTLLRQLDNEQFINYRLDILDKKEEYIFNALKLEDDIKLYFEGKRKRWGSRKDITLKVRDEFRAILFKNIKTNSDNSENQSDTIVEEYTSISALSNIDERLKDITPRNIEKICNESFSQSEMGYWKDRYAETQKLKKQISKSKSKFTRYVNSLKKSQSPDQNSELSLYKKILEEVVELQELAKKYGGQAILNLQKLNVVLELPDSLFKLKPINESESVCIVGYDTEMVGWKGSKYEPKGFNPRIVTAVITTDNFEIHYDGKISEYKISENIYRIDKKSEQLIIDFVINKESHSVVVGDIDIDKDQIISPHTNQPARYFYQENKFKLTREVSNIFFEINPSLTVGTNIQGFDFPKSKNPRRYSGAKDEIFLDEKLRRYLLEDQNMFLPNSDNSTVIYYAKDWLEDHRTVPDSLDFLKIMKCHFSLFTTDSKLVTTGEMLDFFVKTLNINFSKTIENYDNMEDRYYSQNQKSQIENGTDMATYVLTDGEAHKKIGVYFYHLINEVSKTLDLNFEYLQKSKRGVPSLYWNKKWYEHGKVRTIFDKKSSDTFKLEKGKREILKKIEKNMADSANTENPTNTKEVNSESKSHKDYLQNIKGMHNNVFLYINPLLLEAGKEVILKDEKLKKLYMSLLNEKDILKKFFKWSVLENIVSTAFVENEMVLSPISNEITKEEFRNIYGVKSSDISTSLIQTLDKQKKLFENEKIIAWDGDLCFTESKSEELEKAGFIPISQVNVFVRDPHEFIIHYLNADGQTATGTRGCSLLSKKQRYDNSYIKRGFHPNFLDNTIYDLIEVDENWEQRVNRVGELCNNIRNNKLSIDNYLMTIKPGHTINTYSRQYFIRKEAKISLQEGIDKAETYTFIVEAERDGKILTEDWTSDDTLLFTSVENKQEFHPVSPFYLNLLWEKGKNFEKTFNSLILSEFKKSEQPFVRAIINKELKYGNFTDKTMDKLRNLYIKSQEPTCQQLEIKF